MTATEPLADTPPAPRRPPCALMTASAAMHADCAALKQIADAGYEVVVVQDDDLERAATVLEKVRRETLAEFNAVAKTGELQRENQELRALLAFAHAGASLYTDDGELQDNREPPFINFRTDSVAEIERKLKERALARIERIQDDVDR